MTRQTTSQPQPLDPRLKNNAKEWMDRNDWYDPSGTDMDSRMVLTLDDAMAKEGWNPTTKEYWDELDARAKKYLPHKYNLGHNTQQKSKSRSPVAGGSGESSSNSGGGAYRLSAERVSALKDAGMWEDSAKRADAIRRFKEFDATNASNK